MSKELIDPTTRSELEEKHGPVIAIEIKDRVFGFRKAGAKDLELYRSRVKRDDDEASERLLRECVVYPGDEKEARAAFAEFVEFLPFASVRIFETFRDAQGGKLSELHSAESPEDADGDKFFQLLDGSVVGVKRPRREQAKRFAAELKGDRIEAAAHLGASCISYPDSEARSRILDANPFLAQTLGDEAAMLGGFELAHVGK